MCVLTSLRNQAVWPNYEVTGFQASVSDWSIHILCCLLLCILPCPSCYYNPSHSYHTSSSAHLGVTHLQPRIYVCRTRSFNHLGVSRLRPSMPTNHPVLPLPYGFGSYCVRISSPILLPPLSSHESTRVSQSFFLSPLGSNMPPSYVPILRTLYPLNTPQIRDVVPPTAPRLPAVSTCIFSPNGFPLTLVRRQLPACPMSCLLISSLASPWSVAGTTCVYPLPSSTLTPKLPTYPTHTIESPVPLPCRKFPTPWFMPPSVDTVSQPPPPRPTFHAWCSAAHTKNHHLFGLGIFTDNGKLVHFPLYRPSPPHLGWDPFTHTLPPSPHPSVGAFSPSIYESYPTANV